VSVIGPYDASKSTSFKTIVGFLRPTSGRVVFDGQDITGFRPDEVLSRGVAYVPQGRIAALRAYLVSVTRIQRSGGLPQPQRPCSGLWSAR
jgi:ABC-type branched-subunit amino acid transport system ATPase component